MSLSVAGLRAGFFYAPDPCYIQDMKNDLANLNCKPCEGGVKPLRVKEAEELLASLHSDWHCSEDGAEISRTFEFPAYSRSLGFANAVAWIAITQGHHPDLLLSYSKCTVSWTTHAIGGLSENDFICAARVDLLSE